MIVARHEHIFVLSLSSFIQCFSWREKKTAMNDAPSPSVNRSIVYSVGSVYEVQMLIQKPISLRIGLRFVSSVPLISLSNRRIAEQIDCFTIDAGRI